MTAQDFLLYQATYHLVAKFEYKHAHFPSEVTAYRFHQREHQNIYFWVKQTGPNQYEWMDHIYMVAKAGYEMVKRTFYDKAYAEQMSAKPEEIEV